MRAAALVQGVFVCINCGVTPRTFPRILHVDTSPHPAPRILHDTSQASRVYLRGVQLFDLGGDAKLFCYSYRRG